VRVRNRNNCCRNRLRGTKVSIGGSVCGQIDKLPGGNQLWVEVKCTKPVKGGMVILETTRAEYLSISGIEVYSARCSGNGCGSVGI
jgi:hypothetical protein